MSNLKYDRLSEFEVRQKMIKIKAGNICNLTDARYFAAIGATWMGFSFKEKSQEKLTIEDAKAIKDWISGPEIIIELDKFDGDLIFELTNTLGANLIQLPISEIDKVPTEYNCVFEIEEENVRNSEIEMIKKTNVFNLIINVKGAIEFLKTIEKFPNAIYNFDMKGSEVQVLLEKYPVKNLELKGSLEEAVGIKSYDDLNELIDWLEEKEMLV